MQGYCRSRHGTLQRVSSLCLKMIMSIDLKVQICVRTILQLRVVRELHSWVLLSRLSGFFRSGMGSLITCLDYTHIFQKSRNSRLKDLEDKSSTNIYCTNVPIEWSEAVRRSSSTG